MTIPRRDLPVGSRWRRPFTILQTNLQEIDAGMDVDAALDAVERMGGDTWLLNAGGITSFYPTDLDFQTRNPHLAERPSGDLFGDAAFAAEKRGIQVIARLDMSKVSARIAAEHPEWLFRTKDGGPQVFNDLYSVCPSGEYYQERLFDVVDEILDRYPVSGIFFNWFNFNESSYDRVPYGACHCAACVRVYAEFSGGEEIPDDLRSAAGMRWRQYTTRTLAALTAKIADHVEARGEDVAVVIREAAPVIYAEANNAYRQMPGNDFWPYAVAQSVSAHRSARPGAAVLVNAVSFVDHGYRMASEQPEQFGQYVVQGIAHGGNPSLFHFGAPGRLPMHDVLEPGAEAMRLRRDHRDVYDGMTSAARIALVQPGYSSVVHGTYWELLNEFRGVYESLIEAHLPFDVVPVDALPAVLESDEAGRYELVILPDVARLGDVAKAVDTYVERGGSVLLTGGAGLDADGRVELATSPAAAAGEALVGPDDWSTYVTLVDQPEADAHRYRAPVIPVTGRRHRFGWSPDAVRHGHLLPPAPYAPPERAYGHVVGEEPAFVTRVTGAGTVAVVPWTIGASYRDYGKSTTRDHLIAIIDALIDRPLRTDLPDRVEVVVADSGDDTIIHLINHTGVGRRTYRQTIPVTGATLRLAGRGAEAAAAVSLRSGDEVRLSADGDDLVIALPALDLFDVIRLTSRNTTTKE